MTKEQIVTRIHILVGLLGCREVSLKYSRGEYDDCPWYVWAVAKTHLLTCKLCDIYVRQIRLINETFRKRWKITPDPLKVAALQKRLLNEFCVMPDARSQLRGGQNMPRITAELSVSNVKSFLQYGIAITEMLGKLEEIGRELAGKIASLEELEGKSEEVGDLRILEKCPMLPVLGAIKKNVAEATGKAELPDFYPGIVEAYVQKYPDRAAVLHPMCIAHQTIRKTFGVANGMDIEMIACRSTTDEKAYATAGLLKSRMTKQEILEKLTGKACLYYCKKGILVEN